LESWETSQHSLIDTRKPRKTCVEPRKPSNRRPGEPQSRCGQYWGT